MSFVPRRALLGAGLAAALAAGVVAAPAAGAASSRAADRAGYVVVLKDSVQRPAAVAGEHRRRHGAQVTRTYGTALKGYAATLTTAGLGAVRRDPRVAYVERDGRAFPVATSQTGATWGLDRIDQRDRPLSTTFTYTATGTGVPVYVIDSGIRPHDEFGSRLLAGVSFVPGKSDSTDDCSGHGTHVAGTIGGTTWGVAKGAWLVPVRVFDCTGGAAWSTVIAAVDWVTAQKKADGGPAVANMSLSGGAYAPMDDAVKASIAAGVTYALAAGNAKADACKRSPGRVAAALTVGATDAGDQRASFSNFGKCLDLFAPGVDIRSAGITSSTEWTDKSGTSMAAPHVAGVAAQHLQLTPGASPAAVGKAIVDSATPNKVGSAGRGSPNRLLFTDR